MAGHVDFISPSVIDRVTGSGGGSHLVGTAQAVFPHPAVNAFAQCYGRHDGKVLPMEDRGGTKGQGEGAVGVAATAPGLPLGLATEGGTSLPKWRLGPSALWLAVTSPGGFLSTPGPQATPSHCAPQAHRMTPVLTRPEHEQGPPQVGHAPRDQWSTVGRTTHKRTVPGWHCVWQHQMVRKTERGPGTLTGGPGRSLCLQLGA